MTRKFSPITVHGRDLDDTWFLLLEYLHKYGREYKITSGSYAGQKRLTFDFVSGFIDHPHARPLAPRVPEASSLPPPTTDEEIEQYFVNYLMNSELESNEEYRYATWIVGGEYIIPNLSMEASPDGVQGINIHKVRAPNQLNWVINHFKEKGLGNEHCYITIGYPESNFAYDMPWQTETERRTSPCLRGLDFRVIDGQLMTHVVYRSWDLVGGWPTNMGGLTLLNEYIADAIEATPGPLAFSCKSLHAYDHTYEYVKTRSNK